MIIITITIIIAILIILLFAAIFHRDSDIETGMGAIILLFILIPMFFGSVDMIFTYERVKKCVVPENTYMDHDRYEAVYISGRAPRCEIRLKKQKVDKIDLESLLNFKKGVE